MIREVLHNKLHHCIRIFLKPLRRTKESVQPSLNVALILAHVHGFPLKSSSSIFIRSVNSLNPLQLASVLHFPPFFSSGVLFIPPKNLFIPPPTTSSPQILPLCSPHFLPNTSIYKYSPHPPFSIWTLNFHLYTIICTMNLMYSDVTSPTQ